jgi:RluA family pseudouridine synthase
MSAKWQNHELARQVLYCDNHLLALIKPAGMLSQADETGDPDLLTLAKDYIARRFDKPGKTYLGLVHRLDRPASGVMILARTSKAASRLTDQFRRRTTVKRYLALVTGHLEGDGVWRDAIVKDSRTPRIVPEDHPRGKPASLEWRALATADGVSLIDVRLHTGRPHQIRLQFASRGHALLGDPRHGAEREFDGANIALHSYYLEIEHPTKRAPIAWSAPPPKSWRGFFAPEIQNALKRFPAILCGDQS